MNIDSIQNGYVLDHIKAGRSMDIYRYLNLNDLDCSVAIIKIDSLISLDLTVLGYIDPGITINIIRDGTLEEKRPLELPQKIVNIIKCKNPRCITSSEPQLDSIFLLSRKSNGKRAYRCAYCETEHHR